MHERHGLPPLLLGGTVLVSRISNPQLMFSYLRNRFKLGVNETRAVEQLVDAGPALALCGFGVKRGLHVGHEENVSVK